MTVTRQMVYRVPSKDPQSAHQCTVYIVRSQVQVQMSSVNYVNFMSNGIASVSVDIYG